MLDSLLGFVEDVLPVTFVTDLYESTADSLGLTRHGRDQVVAQNNSKELMALQQQYHQENFDREFSAANAEYDRRYLAYQTPQAQVQQLSRAGLSPAVMVQHGGAGFSPASSLQPSTPSPASISPGPQNVSNNSRVVGLEYLDAMSKMKLNDAQRQEILDLLKGRMREQDDQHNLALTIQAQKEWNLALDKAYGHDERANKLANLVNEGLLLYMQHKESEANAKFLQAKTQVATDEHLLNEQQRPLLKLYLEALTQAARAKSSADYAQAGYYSALSQTENALREYTVEINKNDATLSSKTLNASIDKVVAEAKAAGMLPEQVEVALEKARKENNLYYVKEIVGMIGTAVGVGAQVYTGGKIAGAMNVRNKLQADFQEWQMNNDVSETVVDTYNRSGKPVGRKHTYSTKRPRRK